MAVSKKTLVITCGFLFIILVLIISVWFILDYPCGTSLYNTSTRNLEYKKCGLVNKQETNNGYIAFLGKIKEFYQKDEAVYITFDFGAFTESLPLGEVDIYSININERQKNTNSSDPADSNGNLIKLNNNSTALFNKKYLGKHAELFLPTSSLKNERLSLINTTFNSKKLSTQTQIIVTREREFWSNCPRQLDKLILRLKQNDKLALLNHNYDKFFNINYKKCIPLVYNMEIFL